MVSSYPGGVKTPEEGDGVAALATTTVWLGVVVALAGLPPTAANWSSRR